MKVRSGRVEKRIKMAVQVRLSRSQNLDFGETVTTENVGPCGVRVLARSEFLPHESILIASVGGEIRTKARVVYCQRLTDDRFAHGLEFEEGILNWWNILKAGTS